MPKKSPQALAVQPKNETAMQPSGAESDVNIGALMNMAITNNVPVETLERLMEMRNKLKAEWAKEQYFIALAAFQSECPVIKKGTGVKTKSGDVAYKYAKIEKIVQQVKPLLEKYGFSYTTKMELKPDGVKSIVVSRHKFGHAEETPMDVPFGTQTNVMSQTQVVAAATTFAKRYAFLNAFGIMTADDDNDGAIKDIANNAKATAKSAAIAKAKTPFESAMNIIMKTTDYKGLREMREKVEKSLKYSPKSKEELLMAIDTRLSEEQIPDGK